MKRRTILFGVCGIANGHLYRQLPLITHFARQYNVVILAYGTSLAYYQKHFAGQQYITIAPVSVPFYKGTPTGINFAASAYLQQSATENSAYINCLALHTAATAYGTPDLVISDYEPVSAQLAYAYDIPLVTIDQQSKYLHGMFPHTLNGQGYIDEVMRLRMFFPKAAARMACSFFAVSQDTKNTLPGDTVQIVPPVLRHDISTLKSPRRDPRTMLVYLTAQKGLEQSYHALLAVLRTRPTYQFHVFLPAVAAKTMPRQPDNVHLYSHGDAAMERELGRCSGIISTAGHSLLSEAMYLGIPVYAMPLPLYEQHMNAYVIGAHGFGMNKPRLTAAWLKQFLDDLPMFQAAIVADRTVLLGGGGEKQIVNYIENMGLL